MHQCESHGHREQSQVPLHQAEWGLCSAPPYPTQVSSFILSSARALVSRKRCVPLLHTQKLAFPLEGEEGPGKV